MEATYPQHQTSSHGWLLVVAFAAVAVGLYLAVAAAPARPMPRAAAPPAEVIVDGYSHSPAEHPNEQDVIRKCLNNKNTWKQDFDNVPPGPDGYPRYMRACYDGKYVVFQVIDKIGRVFKERTAYIRQGFNSPTNVTKYVDRVNYHRIPGGLR